MFSDYLKLQLYQHRGQLNLLKVEVYLKPPHLNIALWAWGTPTSARPGIDYRVYFIEKILLGIVKLVV